MQAVSVEVVGDPVGDVKIPCVVHILLKSLVVVDWGKRCQSVPWEVSTGYPHWLKGFFWWWFFCFPGPTCFSAWTFSWRWRPEFTPLAWGIMPGITAALSWRIRHRFTTLSWAVVLSMPFFVTNLTNILFLHFFHPATWCVVGRPTVVEFTVLGVIGYVVVVRAVDERQAKYLLIGLVN